MIPGRGPMPGVPDQIRGVPPSGASPKGPLMVVLGMLLVVAGATVFGLYSQGYLGDKAGDRIRGIPDDLEIGGGAGTPESIVPEVEAAVPAPALPKTEAPELGRDAEVGAAPIVPEPPATAAPETAAEMPDEGEIPAALPDWTQPKLDIQGIPATTAYPAPEAALRLFLAAPDWKTRLRYSQSPARVGPKMRAYYANPENRADGQIGVLSIELKVPGTTDRETNSAFIFEVRTVDGPGAFPVSVVAGHGGEFRVDWEPFVQCQDALLERFAASPKSGAGEFYVLLKRQKWDAEALPSEDPLHSFIALPPHLGERNIRVHVPASSDLGRSLEDAMGWESGYFRVIELTWDKTSTGHDYLRINRIVSENWSLRD